MAAVNDKNKTTAAKRRTSGSGSAKAPGAGARKSSSGKGGSRSSSGKKSAETGIAREAAVLIMLALSLIFFIANFGVGGVVGRSISSFFFGLFGLIAYIFPLLLFGGTIFAISNKNNSVARIKIIAGVLVMLLVCTLIQLISGSHASEWKFTQYYTVCSENKSGGGFFGGSLCKLFVTWFGTIGAYIIDIVLIIIGVVVISERSFIAGLKKGSRKVYDTAKNDVEQYRENADERRRFREENRLKRAADKVHGVTLDTEIVMENDADSEDVHEVRADSLKEPAGSKQASKDNAEPVFSFARSERSADILPFDDDRYSRAQDVSEYAIKHYEEEQSSPLEGFGGAYEETVYEPGQDYVPEEENDGGYIDMGLVREEFERELADRRKNGAAEEPEEPEYGGEAGRQYAAGEVPDYEEGYDAPTVMEREPLPETAGDRTAQGASGQAVSGARAAWDSHSASGVRAAGDSHSVSPTDSNAAVSSQPPQKTRKYVFPPLKLLKRGSGKGSGADKDELKSTAMKLQQTLANFGVKVTVTDVSCGPAVTRYEIQPEQGVKVSKIVSLADDIKLNLAAADIRIEAPIPGKAAVGIEVPNKENSGVMLGDLICSGEFKKHPSAVAFAAGKDIAGQIVMADIAKMPHLLIAGATGSGKSVCINTIIMSILYKAKPNEVKLIMVDPKVVELSVYNGIPHLMIPVVTDPKKAAGALNWAVAEMNDRYQKFAQYGVRDLKGYNEKVEAAQTAEDDKGRSRLPQIVIIVDELADLMMVASNEVEDAIVRLAQLARAAGIHLIIATQRPSVNVITGLIKANIPSRIAFSVSSGVDSRTIIDRVGAEKLLGKGDMLFYPQGYQKPARVQGAFVSDEEVSAVVEFLKEHSDAAEYSEEITERISNPGFADSQSFGGDRDQYFGEAGRFIIEKERASIGMLQRIYKIGFNRAARIMDQLCEAGVVGPEEGTKPRKVLMTAEEFEEYLRNN